MLRYLPLWLYLLDFIILAVLSVFLFFTFAVKRRMHKKIKTALEEGKSIPPLSKRMLFFYSDYIEKLSRTYGRNIPLLTGLDEQWLQKFKIRPTRKNMLRLLKYIPEKSLFDVLQGVLAQPRLSKAFTWWIETSGEFMILKRIALSGNGRTFDGNKAARFFKEDIETLIEMTADPQWQCRYFAFSILVHDSSSRGDQVLKEAFHDSHRKNRQILINSYQSDDKTFVYRQLLDCFLNDPVFEVRKHAKIRIDREFQDLYTVQPGDLSLVQKLHLVELLHTGSSNDENIGISFLESGNKELELYASRYLSKTGTLSRLLKTAEPGDSKTFNRSHVLLKSAVAVNCTDFLKEITQTDNPGSLLLASRFLQDAGSRLLITPLLEKAVTLYRENHNSPVIRELYTNALRGACRRGNDKVLLKISHELAEQKYSPEVQSLLLPELPERGDTIFVPVLTDFLKDPEYTAEKELHSALIRFPVSPIVPEMLTIIQSSPGTYPAAIKKRALRILGKMETSCGIQHILENLPLLSLEEAKEFTRMFVQNTPESFDERALLILSSHDASIRSRLIAALPKDHVKHFVPVLLASLQDGDPEIRTACVWALSDYGDSAVLKKCALLLNDPVEEVRRETAKALCLSGREAGLPRVESVLFDTTSSDSVKRAVISGLGEAGTQEAFTLLTKKLAQECGLPAEMEAALVKFDSDTRIGTLFKMLDNVPPSVQPILMRVLENLGPKAEKAAVEIFKQKNTALEDHAAEILEKSGFIDRTVRQLRHRDPTKRLAAAEMLSLIGTAKAYRGLITAAKDPVEKIRITVIKAVDRLNTREGRELLEELKNDPDRNVRRYTLWALERAEAKELN